LPGSVLILVENLSVPFDRRVWQECRTLTGAGFDVSVICPQGTKRDRDPFELREGVAIHRYPLEVATGGMLGYLREYGSALWHTWRLARKLERERRFDVVQVCNPPDVLFLAVRFLRRRGARFVFDHHDLVPELYLSRFTRGRDFFYRLTCFLERATFRTADVVISTNESYRRVALTRGRKDPADVFVVRSAPELERFGPRAPDAALKRGRAQLIGYLGVMGPQDGVDHALQALALLRERRSDWYAVFVGEGDVLPAMKRLALDLGLDDAVEFTGRLPDEDVMRILSTAAVCLAPDPKNPLNDVSTMNKIVEYMAMGRPVVAYDLVEARVSAGDAALYAKANDAVSFAACIEELLERPEQAAAMGARGRARVADALSWERSEQALLAAYDRALCRDGRRSAAAPPASTVSR
jgi:glycosyltransferase involved in cell wall biosynthesis